MGPLPPIRPPPTTPPPTTPPISIILLPMEPLILPIRQISPPVIQQQIALPTHQSTPPIKLSPLTVQPQISPIQPFQIRPTPIALSTPQLYPTTPQRYPTTRGGMKTTHRPYQHYPMILLSPSTRSPITSTPPNIRRSSRSSRSCRIFK